MWRIRWPDGRLSEMANITHAKDAAMALAERGPPRRNARLLRWKQTRESPSAPRTRVRLPTTAEQIETGLDLLRRREGEVVL